MDTSKMLRIKRKGILYGLVDNDGQVVFPFKYEQIKPFDIRGHTIIKEYEGKAGIVDIYGNIIVPLQYDKIETLFSSGPARAYKNEKYGCVDIDGNEVVPFVYDSISAWGEYLGGTALVELKGKYGVINKNGEVIVPIKYKDESEAIEKNKNIDKNKIQKTKAKKSKQPTEEIKDKVVRGFFPRDDEVEIPSGFTKIGYFDQGNAIVFKDGKYGLINTKCEIVIPTKYDFLRYVKGGVLYACSHGIIGLIDEDDDIIAPFIYDFIDEFPRNGLLSVCRGGKLGFINLLGEETIPAIYDIIPDHFSISYEKNGRYYGKETTIPTYKELVSYVPIYNKWHFTNEVVGPFIHNNNFREYGYLIVIRKKNKWGIIDLNGSVTVPFEYDEIGDLYNNFFIPVKAEGKWGFVNQYFNTIIPCIYDEAEQYGHLNCFKVKKNNYWAFIFLQNDWHYRITEFKYHGITRISNDLSIVRKGSKYGIIDDNFQEIVPVLYDEIEDYLYNQKLKLKVGDKWGWAYFDENLHYTLSPFLYEEFEDFSDGLALVKKNGMYGFINENWDEVIPFVYEEAFPFLDGISSVKHNEKWGVIDTNGDTLIPFEYEKLVNFSWLGPSAIVASKEGKVGVVDRQNRVIVPFEYTTIFPASNHLIVEKDGKKGLMNSEGNIVIPICCEEILYPILNIRALEQLFKYKIDGEWGVYNHFDGILVPAIYVDIPDTSFSCGRLSVCRDGKWGYINPKGKEIIPCIYDKNPGAFFPSEPVRVSLDGKEFCIDTKGNMV